VCHFYLIKPPINKTKETTNIDTNNAVAINAVAINAVAVL
jgi:hypothetical protein